MTSDEQTGETKSPEEVRAAAEEAKAKFREALEKKNAHQHPHEEGAGGFSKASGPHGRSGKDKTFRRKSG